MMMGFIIHFYSSLSWPCQPCFQQQQLYFREKALVNPLHAQYHEQTDRQQSAGEHSGVFNSSGGDG